MASPSWRVCLGGETATGAPARGFGLQQVDLQLHLQSPQRDQQSGNVWGVVSRSVMSSSLWSHGLQPTRLLCPWDSSGKSTGVGCHALLQGIFPTQGLNLCFLHCRQILYCLSHQVSPSETLITYIFPSF